MIRSVMESAGLTFWPLLSLVLFCLFVVSLSLWLYRRGSAGHYRAMAGLALGDGENAKDESLEGGR